MKGLDSTVALYAIGDPHLSLAAQKPMDIFPGWENHAEKLCDNWKSSVTDGDTVVICGDSSWGMTLEEALADLALLNSLPGKKKLLLKGNHDYWWSSAAKMRAFFETHGLLSLDILHNNAHEAEGFAICGSRGWIFENGKTHDDKIINREAMRIEASLKASSGMCGERILFLHYPPVFAGQELAAYIDLMRDYGITRCFYGHIHGAGLKSAVQGKCRGVDFTMISADHLGFAPLRINLSK